MVAPLQPSGIGTPTSASPPGGGAAHRSAERSEASVSHSGIPAGDRTTLRGQEVMPGGSPALRGAVSVLAGACRQGRRTADCARKQMAANRRFAAGDFGGKCERGLPPFTISNDESELAAARRRRARELRLPSQERLGVGFPDPSPSRSGVSVRLSPHFGNPAQSAGRSAGGAPTHHSLRTQFVPPLWPRPRIARPTRRKV